MEVNPAYNNMMGTWSVTTEGDCEGRSVIHLGTYTGYVDEIAFHLADKCYYSLNFKAVTPVKKFSIKQPAVHVTLDIDSGTWDMNPAARAGHVRMLFAKANRPVNVKTGTYYASVVLEVPNPEKTKQDILKQQALGKLTDEEKAALGLVNKE